MKIKTRIKRITALALVLIVIAGLIPMIVFADGTYTFPSNSQSGDNNSILRYSLTDENAGSITVKQINSHPALYLSIDEGWYFDTWDTYFNGNEDRPILSDPVVRGNNPVSDEGKYTFFNVNQKQPFSNVPFLYIATATNFYGDHKVVAVLKPILTVNAGEGVNYQVITNYPSYTDLAANQVAVKYKDNATVTYTVDNKYIVTDVSANYGTNYSISGKSIAISSIIKPATINVNTRLKRYNVHFDANGGKGTMDAQVFEHSTAQTLTPNSFTMDGYIFGGWNTKADGSGISYSDNQSVTFTPANDGDAITLYAQWRPKQHTVTYKADGETVYTEMVNHGKDATLPAVPKKEGFAGKWDSDGKNITADTTITAIYSANSYMVSFDANGGEAIDPISVIFGDTYGNLPASVITGLSGGDKNWYLVDEKGNVTDTKITKLSKVLQSRNHTLFVKRSVLAPSVKLTLSVSGGISDNYQYYIPGNSTRILTATISNRNDEVLNYTYRWYKDDKLIAGQTNSTLTLAGNVADSGTYQVEVTATLKDGTNIVATSDSATGSKELQVKILHAANTLYYDANGGEGDPQSSYTGGTSLSVSKDVPNREHYDFIGWNTKPDGTGEEYKAEDLYTFADDGGNGGCVVTLYAQWKLKEYTVTYTADGETVSTQKVEHGKDATLPAVPKKVGYVGKWDGDGKNITGDTTITAVYMAIPDLNPDEVKPEDKSAIEDVKAKLEEELKDDAYTDEDKKEIQDAIDSIDEALEVISNVEEVEELIDKLPDTITKDDEAAIKAADDAYNTLTDYEKSLIDEDAKKALEDAKAALAELNEPASSPQTGDNSNLWMWFVLLFVSGAGVFGIILNDRKTRAKNK